MRLLSFSSQLAHLATFQSPTDGRLGVATPGDEWFLPAGSEWQTISRQPMSVLHLMSVGDSATNDCVHKDLLY